jgi:hypothetical protein
LTNTATRTAPTFLKTLLWAVAVVAFAAFTIVTQGFAAPDESWFLQVVTRMHAGDTLYRDMYFNVTPLSAYLTYAATGIFGTELVVVRAVVAAALAMTVACFWLACRRLGAGRAAPWLLVSWWAQPAPYTPLAMACFAASFYAAVVWMRGVQERRESTGILALAALAAGLCLGAKQNLGLYCLAALLLSILIVGGRDLPAGASAKVGRLSIAVSAFLLAAAATLLPVYATGALDRFLVCAFDKTTYLEMGGVPYSAAVERFRVAAASGWSLDAVAAAYRELAFLLPPVTFALLAAVCLRGSGIARQTALVVTLFVGAGYLVVFPFQGGSSNIYAIPVLVAGLAYGWTAVRPIFSIRMARAITVVVTILVATQIGLRFVRQARVLASPDYVTSDLRHFRWMRVPRAQYGGLTRDADLLSRLAAGKPLFLVGPNTGFFYLAAGVTNPYSFDYPYASVFGRAGQQDVIARIRAGEIGAVFIFADAMDRQTPWLLQEFVQTTMTPVQREHLGVLYR